MEQIKDMVTLRHEAMKLATLTISTPTALNGAVAYDINNHLAIAKAIENYIKGDANIPETDNSQDEWKNIMAKVQDNFPKPAEPKAPNFEIKK